MSNNSKNNTLNYAVYNNTYRILYPQKRSLGFHPHNSQTHVCPDTLSDHLGISFLINTTLVRNDVKTSYSVRNYFTDPGMFMVSKIGEEHSLSPFATDLLEPLPLELDFQQVIERRRSCRIYTGDSISLQELSTLLRASYGVTANTEKELSNGIKTIFKLRSTPSGGGLYPIDLYFVSMNVKGLSRGLYRYNPLKNQIFKMQEFPEINKLLQAFAVPEDLISLSQSCIIVFFIANPWRTLRKYGDRGIRFVLQEAGAISQMFHLSSAALGLGSVDCASYFDDEIHQLLNLDGIQKLVVHSLVIGYPG